MIFVIYLGVSLNFTRPLQVMILVLFVCTVYHSDISCTFIPKPGMVKELFPATIWENCPRDRDGMGNTISDDLQLH